MTTRKTRRRRRVLAGLLLLGSLPLALLLLLQTEGGRQMLGRWLSRALSSGRHSVRLDEIRVPRLSHWSVGGVFVSDPAGPWLTIRKVDLEWTPRALLDGRIEVRRLHVGSVELARLPAAEGTESSEKSLPNVPDFRVEALALGELRVAAGVWGVPMEMSDVGGRVQGGGSNGAVRVGLNVSANRLSVSTCALERVSADVEVSFARSHWALPRIEISGDGLRASGHLASAGVEAWPKGSLRLEADGSAEWTRSLWPGLSVGKIAATLDCAPGRDDRAVVRAQVAANDVQVDGCAVRAVAAQIEIQRTRTQSDLAVVEGKGSLADLSAGELAVTGAEFSVSGRWRDVSVAATAGGVYRRPFAMDAAGRLQWGPDWRALELQRATVGWAGVQARLVEPLRLRAAGDQVAIRGACRTEPFDLSSISSSAFGVRGGRVTAGLRVNGTLADPAFEGDIACEGIVARSYRFASVPAASGSCVFGFSNRTLRASAEASKIGRAHV
jgi:autotransporter translocation and assembly factor TamB